MTPYGSIGQAAARQVAQERQRAVQAIQKGRGRHAAVREAQARLAKLTATQLRLEVAS